MFDLIEGFQSKDIKSVTVRHLKRMLFFFVIAMLVAIGINIVAGKEALALNSYNWQFFVVYSFLSSVFYIKEVAGLRKSNEQ